jgi:hypothetical protein
MIILFVLGAMFSFSTSALSQGLYDLPGGTFVDNPTAIDLITDYMENELKPAYQTALENDQANPGDPIYEDLQRKKFFYFAIRENIENGNGVAVSIVHGLNMFKQDTFGDVSEAQKFELRNDAIRLLRK